MPDYKEMYLKLFRATEKAINELINAQQECEELYLNAEEPELKVLPFVQEEPKAPLCKGSCQKSKIFD